MPSQRPPEAPEERDFDRPTPEEKLKWFDQDKDADDLREIADRNEAGALTMPMVYTSYIEFRVEQPDGAHTVCTCNECWNEFYMGAFAEAVECPFCHATAIHTEKQIG